MGPQEPREHGRSMDNIPVSDKDARSRRYSELVVKFTMGSLIRKQ